jgi:hypothetical protein
MILPACVKLGTVITDLSNKNPDSNFRKFRSSNGIYYLVNYNLWFSLARRKLNVESVFRDQVKGVLEVNLELYR